LSPLVFSPENEVMMMVVVVCGMG